MVLITDIDDLLQKLEGNVPTEVDLNALRTVVEDYQPGPTPLIVEKNYEEVVQDNCQEAKEVFNKPFSNSLPSLKTSRYLFEYGNNPDTKQEAENTRDLERLCNI